MQKRRDSLTPFLTAAVLSAATIGIVYLLFTIERTPAVPRSAIGFDGLAALLDANDIQSRTLSSAAPFDPDAIGLRILPLYDDDLSGFNSPVVSDEDVYLNPSIRPIPQRVVEGKIATLPTLVVLSKWRDGIRQAGFIHPDFLLPSDRTGINADANAETTAEAETSEDLKPDEDERESNLYAGEDDIDQIGFEQVEFRGFRRLAALPPREVETISAGRYGSADVYAPQYAVAPSNCEALVGENRRGLLFECISGGQVYWVLSDPDLLNNHGLARGDNARTAINLVRDLADGGEVMIDYTLLRLLADEARGRSLSDLLRYFGPPFRALWLAALVVLIILLWRGAIRGVPLVRRFTEGHGAARRTSFAAQAALMRRSRADGALLKALLNSRLAVLSDRLLGRDVPKTGRRDRLLRAIRHRNAAVADELEAAVRDIESLAETTRTDAAVPALARLETAYRKVLELS